jgi:non-ribosomal peptide synthetase-like protein
MAFRNAMDRYGEVEFDMTVQSATVVSDGLSVVNLQLSNTSFRVDPVRIGDRNFLGNDVVFPSGARTGENVLLATKVMVPLDGPVRRNTGLLGSPAFEIPRTNPARSEFDVLDDADEIRRR